MPAASVIVATHRGRDRIGALLDSLAAQTADHEVLAVDNASEDGTAAVLAGYPKIEVIRADRNLGFGRAVNLAARRAAGNALVLVNDDCVCDPTFVERIVEPLAGDTVMSAGVLRDQSDPGLIDTAGMELDPTLNVFDYLHGHPIGALKSARPPIGPSGAAAAFARDAFLEAGGFDENLFAYWEDVDLVLRLRLQGADCALAGAGGVHAHSATLGSGSPEKNRLMGFGRGYVLRKWSVLYGPQLARVLLADGLVCAGQGLLDRNLAGVGGRLSGARAADRSFAYPHELLRGHPSPGMLEDLQRRLNRRRRLNRLREETAREGIERELAPVGSDWAPPPGDGLAAELTAVPESPLQVGGGNVFFLGGRLSPPEAGGQVELLVDGAPADEAVTVVNPDGGDSAFWWTLLPLPGANGRPEVTVSLRRRNPRRTATDVVEVAKLAIERGNRDRAPDRAGLPRAIEAAEGGPLVAICMATYEPPPALFAEQIESIRAQTHAPWICIISDDGSSRERLAAMREVIGEDPRFVLIEHERNVGFYRNYERALAAVPAQAEFVALADQDDRWDPDKLETLVNGLGDRDLVYGDMRIVGEGGARISGTYWNRRRNNYADLASLLVGNTVTGAASLFRRGLLEHALPFPPPRPDSYHDHWIALVAMAGRGLAYVDRPIQDYVQHAGAAQGHEEANRGASYLQLRMIAVLIWQGLWTLLGRHESTGWASRYFGVYVRTVSWARTLLIRRGDSLTGRQRRVLRRIAFADRSPIAMAWLAGRSLRPLWGANEAFGRELLILTSVLWEWTVRVRCRLPFGAGIGPRRV